jgi:hypothetical protein
MMEGNQFDALARRMASGASRRRMLKGIAGGVAALFGGGAVTRQASARTLTICHSTGNPAAPFQSLTIDQAEFNLHARHGDYLRVECCADADCPSQYGSCGAGVCQSGYCAQLPVAAGTSCDEGLFCNGDSVCDGAFSCVPGSEVICPDTENPCTANVCDESARGCIEVVANEGQSCGGDRCEPDFCRSGACVTEPVICTPSVNFCLVTACNAQNGQCEDVVQVGQPCVTGGGQNGFCDAQAACVPSETCTDGIKNGSETDVDCGGGSCPPCANGKMCGINADCESNRCLSGFCVDAGPTCTDGIKNGNETDIDCGGICPKCANGKMCGIDADCDSGNCVGGICTICPSGQAPCGNVCIDVTNDPSNCGACGIVCPGYMKPFTNVSCQQSICTFSCQGEHYDVDGDPANGCEVVDAPAGNHTQQQAISLGSISCEDASSLTIDGIIPSDDRVHANPAVTGFDTIRGAAPDWFVVRATGGLCQNDIVATLTVSGTAIPICFQLQVITNKFTYSAIANGSGIATINHTLAQYSDDTDVYFEVSKICSSSVNDVTSYTLSFHL